MQPTGYRDLDNPETKLSYQQKETYVFKSPSVPLPVVSPRFCMDETTRFKLIQQPISH
jgi:hypothetical protein